MLDVTRYCIPTNKAISPFCIALASDLHNEDSAEVLSHVRAQTPDLIAVTGDLINGYKQEHERGLAFLAEAAHIAPTFYSLGNHERDIDERYRERVHGTSAVLLDNAVATHRGIAIAGLTSSREGTPDLALLRRFAAVPGFRLLLCHHPEYFRFVKPFDIDLTLCGHAHGGQVRLPGIGGLYAPGQGWFPKYTAGVFEENGRTMVISRGIGNAVAVPRIFNRGELVLIDVAPNSK